MLRFSALVFCLARGEAPCRCAPAPGGSCGYWAGSDQPWCKARSDCAESWLYCDERGVERRRADDGSYYNLKEMRELYGAQAAAKWEEAESLVERKLCKNGNAYTSAETHDYYSDLHDDANAWLSFWADAPPEYRKVQDQHWQKYEEVRHSFGGDAGLSVWKAATTQGDYVSRLQRAWQSGRIEVEIAFEGDTARLSTPQQATRELSYVARVLAQPSQYIIIAPCFNLASAAQDSPDGRAVAVKRILGSLGVAQSNLYVGSPEHCQEQPRVVFTIAHLTDNATLEL
eukprot:gnl/TRDRNA2_/TRDRNA2_43464_c0_seq1.p1 gnl/TRDRNA2_/TRDRNA2_43464_c0~~gnl/TRDRNA2_/TRDRNA2_43464_c0_seq1.p1  ORF type:complete len:286 (+),score=44.14 gnl/TRDRNA2_/TRDRNA2_43464_c0_seq1:51-908(+)